MLKKENSGKYFRINYHLKSLPDSLDRDILFHDFQNLLTDLANEKIKNQKLQWQIEQLQKA